MQGIHRRTHSTALWRYPTGAFCRADTTYQGQPSLTHICPIYHGSHELMFALRIFSEKYGLVCRGPVGVHIIGPATSGLSSSHSIPYTIIMPPALDHPCLHLTVLEPTFITFKFPPNAVLPADVLSALAKPELNRQLFSLSRTPEETSLVCAAEDVSLSDPDIPKWRCIKIKGPMEFGRSIPHFKILNV